MIEKIQTVIGVPGQWANRSDIVTSIASRSDGYLFAGMVMIKTGETGGFLLNIHDRDPELENAFSIAGRGSLKEQDLNAIGSHTFVLYLGGEGGSINAGKKLLHAANALLKSGGLAIKIESAGIAHSSEQWSAFCARDDIGALLSAYVTYVGGAGVYYSCGMHNLGHSDITVEAKIPPADAARLLHTFAGYLLAENPTLKDRETFSVDVNAPRYRLFHERCARFKAEDLFHNPFGVWKMVPA